MHILTGNKIVCQISGDEKERILDGEIYIDGQCIFACQNSVEGSGPNNMLGYKYGFLIGFTTLTTIFFDRVKIIYLEKWKR